MLVPHVIHSLPTVHHVLPTALELKVLYVVVKQVIMTME